MGENVSSMEEVVVRGVIRGLVARLYEGQLIMGSEEGD
jgi:hypothetical protein